MSKPPLALCAVGVLLSTVLTEARAAHIEAARFRSDPALVLVPVTVTDRRGATISGLKPDVFTVLEDRSPQPIISFSEQDSFCSLGLVLDLSGSMKDDLAQEKAALRALLSNSDPRDEALLVTVSDRPVVQKTFTRDFGAVLDKTLSAQAGGSTALIDTVYLGLSHMRRASNSRKALLVISDGMDNHSHYSIRELMSLVSETDVQIYTIAIDQTPRNRKAMELQERSRGLALLSDLAWKSGGLSFVIRNASDLEGAARNIDTAIRNEYVIGYRPPAPIQTGKWRAIQVKLGVPNTRVYARRGYYAQ